MRKSEGKRLLIISMEYEREEINEPINIDILLQCIPADLFEPDDVYVEYRKWNSTSNVCYQNYDIILISTKLTSYEQFRMIVKECNNKIIIVGGILAIAEPKAIASEFNNLILHTGEAETNMEQVLRLAYASYNVKDLKEKIIRHGVENICFYYESEDLSSTSKHNHYYFSRRTICNLNVLPALIHHSASRVIEAGGLIRMETSRGCPWNQCTFCIMPWKFAGSRWRAFSEKKVEEEVRSLANFPGISQIFFTDEDFIGNREHIDILCQAIRRGIQRSSHRDKQILFGGSTSILTLWKLGEDLDRYLQKLKAAGISFLFIGIESGSDTQLERYQKGATVVMNESVLKSLKKFDFELDYGFILFDADTTVPELKENLEFIERNGLLDFVARFDKQLRLSPHTEFFGLYKARKLITSGLNLDQLTYK